MDDNKLFELANKLFLVQHPGTHTTNITWDTCSEDLRKWYAREANWLIVNGYIHESQAVDYCEVCKKCHGYGGWGLSVCEPCQGKGLVLKPNPGDKN